MCTPWASDSVVPASDWAGVGRFSGEWRIYRGWNPVRVPVGHSVSPLVIILSLLRRKCISRVNGRQPVEHMRVEL